MQDETSIRREKRKTEIFETINDWELSNVIYQITDPGSSENKQEKYQKTTPRHIILKLHKIKDKLKKILKEVRGKKHHTYRETTIRITFNFSETMWARREWNKIFKVLREEKPTTLEFCALQYCPLKVKEK